MHEQTLLEGMTRLRSEKLYREWQVREQWGGFCRLLHESDNPVLLENFIRFQYGAANRNTIWSAWDADYSGPFALSLIECFTVFGNTASQAALYCGLEKGEIHMRLIRDFMCYLVRYHFYLVRMENFR
jgi:hypothetical protein